MAQIDVRTGANGSAPRAGAGASPCWASEITCVDHPFAEPSSVSLFAIVIRRDRHNGVRCLSRGGAGSVADAVGVHAASSANRQQEGLVRDFRRR